MLHRALLGDDEDLFVPSVSKVGALRRGSVKKRFEICCSSESSTRQRLQLTGLGGRLETPAEENQVKSHIYSQANKSKALSVYRDAQNCVRFHSTCEPLSEHSLHGGEREGNDTHGVMKSSEPLPGKIQTALSFQNSE